MNRTEKSTSIGMPKRARPESVDVALAMDAKRLHERLSARDVQLLARCQQVPVDVETVDHDAHDLLWLTYHKLLDVSVDGGDRVWLRTTPLGKIVRKAWLALISGQRVDA